MKEKMGLIVTDASYHQEMKYASIGVVDLVSGKEKKEEVSTVKNIKEAESYGIIKALKSFVHVYESITVFCDNIHAVFETRKKVIGHKYWANKYKIIQIIWVPREYTGHADALSRICENIEETKKIKEDSFKNNVLEDTSISDVFLDREDYSRIVKDLYREEIDISFKSKSTLFKNIILEENVDFDSVKDEMSLIKDDSIQIIKALPEQGRDSSALKKILKIGLMF